LIGFNGYHIKALPASPFRSNSAEPNPGLSKIPSVEQLLVA